MPSGPGTVRAVTSLAAGQIPTPYSLLPAATLAAASEVELANTIAAILAEQHQRALSGGDLDALVEQAFVDGFTRTGQATPPWLSGGWLICPGYRRDRSATSHECCFVSVDGRWVWELSPAADVVRQVPGPKSHTQTVTVVFVEEGAKIDMVSSASRSGSSCQMRSARSFQIRAGELVEVAIRARKPDGHR